jgi:hypothetical protein
MNWLKSVSNAIFGGGNETAVELIKVDGTLYMIRVDGVRGGHECLFPDACAVIRRTEDPFVFEMVVTRMIDEDDVQDDEEPENENETYELTFVITKDMRFYCDRLIDAGETTPTFLWVQPGGNPDHVYEFAINGADEASPIVVTFRQTWLECLYQAQYLRSHENADPSELEELLWDPTATSRALRAKRGDTGKPKEEVSFKQDVHTPATQEWHN